MLKKEEKEIILDAVREKPRTIQELAASIQKNWRTADRYVESITAETGLISTRTFRGGTRGALKVVYWSALEQAKGSAFQEHLLQRIRSGRRKEDFSPFDIFQFVDENKREAFLSSQEFSRDGPTDYITLFEKAQQQVLVFSGNLSWFELVKGMRTCLEKLANRSVRVKVLTRITVTSQKKVKELLAMNQRVGWDAVEVRHCEHPLRMIIIDDEVVSLKEVVTPLRSSEAEKAFIFYHVRDGVWISWLQKVFWDFWRQSIDAQRRLRSVDAIEQLGVQPHV